MKEQNARSWLFLSRTGRFVYLACRFSSLSYAQARLTLDVTQLLRSSKIV